MPLENDIQELTKAVLALTYALNQQRGDVTSVKQDAAPSPKEAVAKAEEKVPNEKSKAATDTSPPSEPGSAPVAYADVKKLIIAISKESNGKAVAALSRLGVANGKELKEAQWPEAVAYLTRVAAGEVNPEESHA